MSCEAGDGRARARTCQDRLMDARSLNLFDLSNDDFEELVFLLAQAQFPKVVRLRAPDGGVDAILPTSNRDYARGWQAKCYRQQINWSECEKSLDTAIAWYALPRITFCFPVDFTRHQERAFAERLATRHRGVLVDTWTKTELLRRLLDDGHRGARVRTRFFGDADRQERIERALLAGGRLDNAPDMLGRLHEVARVAARSDPHYQYVTSSFELGDAEPTPHPARVIGVAVARDGLVSRIDATPRASDPPNLPRGHLTFSDDDAGRAAAEAVAEALRDGTPVAVQDGVVVCFDDAPALLREMLVDVPHRGGLTLDPNGRIFPARIEIDTTGTAGALELDLAEQPGTLSDGIVFRGEIAGLSIELALRRDAHGSSAAIAWKYGFPSQPAEAALHHRIALFLRALHQKGDLKLASRIDPARSFEFKIAQTPEPAALTQLEEFFGAVATVETWVGRDVVARLPLRPDDEHAVVTASQLVRDQAMPGTFVEMSFICVAGSIVEPFAGPLRHRETLYVRLFGVQYELGELELVLDSDQLVFEVTESETAEDGSEQVAVRISGRDGPIPISRRLIRPSLLADDHDVRDS